MNRYDELRKFADKNALGVEVAPFFNPTVPKSEGYNVLVVDIFDTETLRKIAEERPQLSDVDRAKIEDVDIECDASRLSDVIQSRGLAGKISYIISSHNFEHLPDPISFFQACSTALEPGGVLSMAIPDGRACFDHFRMPTRLSDWLCAYHRGYSQPPPELVFDCEANYAPYLMKDGKEGEFNIAYNSPDGFAPMRNLKSAYEQYSKEVETPGPYRDRHCSVVFGASFELMLRDLRHLGLTDLDVVEVSPTKGIEFFVHLRKAQETEQSKAGAENEDAFYERRHQLLKEVNFLLGSQGLSSSSDKFSLKRIVRVAFGEAFVQRVSAMNASRRAKRRRSAG